MALVQFIQQVWPQAYWSAGFIACLLTVIALCAVLWVITRWSEWVFAGVSAIIYLIPFFLYMR